MAEVVSEKIFSESPLGATAPDSLTIANGSLWAVWGNGASSTAYPGTNGSSTIVQYSRTGAIENSYTIGGHVDGLKYDPATGDIWALQNEDANSTLTLIDPATGQMSSMLQYGSGYVYGANSARGFDDVVFKHGKVFVSQTSPNPGDPVVSELINGNAPFGTLETQSILRLGDTGTNLVTGQTNQDLPVSDPNSLKLLPNGSLILTSEADKAFTFIHNPGQANQTESFINLPAGSGTPDDAVMVNATSGTFYVSAQSNNEILAIKVSDINPHDLYASIGNELDQIDLKTGAITTLASGLNGAHGLQFVPSGGGMSRNNSSHDSAVMPHGHALIS